MPKKKKRDGVNPPANKEAEANLLSAMLSAPDEIGKVMERITQDDFFYPAHQSIYGAMVALYTRSSMDESHPIDATAVWEELQRTGKHTEDATDAESPAVSGSYLQHIAGSAPSIRDVAYYQDLILECHRNRQLQRMTADIEQIASGSGEFGDKTQRIQERLRQLDTPQAAMEVVRLGDSLTQHARALQGDLPGRVDSGFGELDRHTGGFYPGDLVVIGARPSMGKTSLALNIGLNVALAGTGVLFVSLEMALSQLRSRALCMLAEQSLSEVRHNPHLADEKRQALFDAADKYETQSPPLFITNAGHTPEEQLMLLRQYRDRHHIGLVIIDYFQLMITDHRQQNLRHMATELSRAVKRLAQAENLPVILTSQLSPEQEDRKNIYPRIADLREFGTIDQDADLIMLLFREDYYRRRDETYGTIEAFEIDIAKHRNGPTGHVKLMFDKEKMMFKDWFGGL